MNGEKTEQLQRIEQAEDKLFNFRPIFFFAVCLCLGGVYALAWKADGVSPWWLLLAVPVFVVAVWLQGKGKRLRAVAAVLLLVLSFLLGIVGTVSKIDDFENTKTYHGSYTVSGKVVGSVRKNETCIVLLQNVKIGKKEVTGKLVAYLPYTFYHTVLLSDTLRLKGEVRTDASAFNEYGFRASVIYDDVRYRATVDAVEDCSITGREFDLFLFSRQCILDTLRRGMDETSAAVTMAMLTGDTSLMGEELLQNMRYGGIAHVFAVSGLHVGALYAFCLLLIGKTPLYKLPKILRFILVASVLFLYGGICGYSASVVRAMVMCLAFYFGKLTGFSSDGLENVGLSAVIILLLSPVALFTVGFQLSFAATIGIILLNKPIYSVLSNIGQKVFCKCKGMTLTEYALQREDRPLTLLEETARAAASFLSVTLSAQIATMPLTLFIFGYVSVWSLLLNCTFVPIISAAFSLLLLLTVLACLLPPAASAVLLYVPSVIWSAVLLVFQTMDFSKGLIESVTLSFSALICYYGACLFITDKWNASKAYKRFMFFAFALLFAVVFFLLNA